MTLVECYRRARDAVEEEKVTERDFLRELAFVICNSGMRASVIRGLWVPMREAFYDFVSTGYIVDHRADIRAAALRVLNSPPKIDAIIDAAVTVQAAGWANTHRIIKRDGIQALRSFKYIGPIIVYHLAKNIGIDVAKPDRHLMRIAEALGYNHDVQRMCQRIANHTGHRVATIDLVLWRYAASVRPGAYLDDFKAWRLA